MSLKFHHGAVVIKDDRTVSPEELMAKKHGLPMLFDDILPDLMSPDTMQSLYYDPMQAVLTDQSGNCYPFRGNLPLLIPSRLQSYYTNRLFIPYDAVIDAFLQYYYLSAIKQSGVIGDINASTSDKHYQRHLYRMREFMASARGKILDIGCDDPLIGAAILPAETCYVGLDPFCVRSDPFRIIGFGEQLPFRDASFDAVVFNTSLDHILDWRKAIDEAERVLKWGGSLYICTLVWVERADLIMDSVHFHHFRDYEIFGALRNWDIVSEQRFDYKGAVHRHGLYLVARKSGAGNQRG